MIKKSRKPAGRKDLVSPEIRPKRALITIFGISGEMRSLQEILILVVPQPYTLSSVKAAGPELHGMCRIQNPPFSRFHRYQVTLKKIVHPNRFKQAGFLP
jgi:hypothetical protein